MEDASATSLPEESTATPRTYCPLIRQFVDFLQLEKHFSAHTVHGYAADLYQFARFLCGDTDSPDKSDGGAPQVTCSESQLDEKLMSCDVLAVREYLSFLFAQRYSKSTTARKLATLRSFYRHQVRSGRLAVNPMSTIRTPKQDKRLPKCMDSMQINTLLSTPADTTMLGARDRAILEVLYSSGLRISELVSLRLADMDLKEGIIRVSGKGRKDRLVPLGSKAIEALNEYFQQRLAGGKMQGPHANQVFVNKHGTPLSDRSVRRNLGKYLLQAGLDTKASPHTLRHTFATHMLDAGADLRSVQELLGHQNLSTTQIYTHLTTTRMKQVYDASHPRARVSTVKTVASA